MDRLSRVRSPEPGRCDPWAWGLVVCFAAVGDVIVKKREGPEISCRGENRQ